MADRDLPEPTDEPSDMLADMIADEAVFFGCYNYAIGKHDDGIYPCINCNDLFAWACADCEPLHWSEIKPAYAAWREGRLARWCCLHRGMRPQWPIEKAWRVNGTWDSEMEALPS